jgi:hypothetical protein
MPRKNPAAVALGRKGGSVRNPKKAAASRRNMALARAKKEQLAKEKA